LPDTFQIFQAIYYADFSTDGKGRLLKQ
jgi:hypothetical protein